MAKSKLLHKIKTIMILRRNILSILFLITANLLNAQFSVNINASSKACQDTITFIAETTISGVPQTEVNYKWDFDDGTIISGMDLDTIKHIFLSGGGYIVRVEANKGTDKDYDLHKIEISLTADFAGTQTDKTEDMCLGQEAVLTGKVNSVAWEHKPELNTEQTVKLIDNNTPYSSTFDYRIFDKTDIISADTDFDTIGIKLEHNNLSNLKIELSCPNGSSIILKDFGGTDKYFGRPDISEAYWYYWTNNPDYGTMNSITPSGQSMPEGSYTPDEPLANLTGCPLNGDWVIKVTDNTNPDSGYVYASYLKFSNGILPPEWSFTNTYSRYVWSGPGVSSTLPTGIASATPTTTGSSEYKFNVQDNFSCWQDTSIFLRVSGASFTANPVEGPFDLEVSFENTTSWASDFLWDFGDNTERSTEENPTHTYTYPDGRYTVLFTATADDGCKDTDTTTITVTIPDAVFNEPPNVFSPNGDGSNDFFKLDVEHFASFEGWIYSRWGKLVKKWNSIDDAKNGWDGKIQESNRDAAPGIYFFYIKAVDYHGQEVFKKGSVQLFR